MMRFTEETGAALDSVTFLVFGAVLLGPVFEHVSWQIALYAVLSLTIVRMLPVAISLWGTHALGPTVAFMGWFGPRGLASIVFAVMVEDAHLAHAATIVAATYLTVGLSVLVHGLSAAPLVSRYANWYRTAADKRPPAMESTTDARAPNPRARHAAEQLTVEHRPRRRCYRSSLPHQPPARNASPKGLKLKSASASRFQSSDLDDWNPGRVRRSSFTTSSQLMPVQGPPRSLESRPAAGQATIDARVRVADRVR